MHSRISASKKINELHEGKEVFMASSRGLAQKAQRREMVTKQPKEYLVGAKAIITIKNYLGGCYYFTCDEAEIHNEEVFLIEGKHTSAGLLPSEGDIKDGLLKMVLFTNLENVIVEGNTYNPIPVLKLTTGNKVNRSLLSKNQKDMLKLLRKEASTNGFRIKINDEFFV